MTTLGGSKRRSSRRCEDERVDGIRPHQEMCELSIVEGIHRSLRGGENERNRFVSLLQSSTQATAEMKEKIRILGNEVEILGKSVRQGSGSDEGESIHL